MLDKLEKTESRFIELEQKLADPGIMNDKVEYQKLARELSEISPFVYKYRDIKKLDQQKMELVRMMGEPHDKDFLELAKLELTNLEDKKQILEKEIQDMFEAQKVANPEDNKDAIVEIRAGTGGQEASIFAGNLYRMYARFAANKNLKVELISSSPTELGGFKEVVFSVSGKNAYKYLKFESGVHRVQRVPETEASGRIHTSAATVAVLIEPEEVDLTIEPKDLKIDLFRSSGAGGQHVNVTDSAVRLTHLPTGLVVTCQDERSQLKNKIKAMRVLRARLADQIKLNQVIAQSEKRKSQVGTGDRSEKIRTYNFPDRRVTDHRIGFTAHNLEKFLEGDMDELVEALIKEDSKNE